MRPISPARVFPRILAAARRALDLLVDPGDEEQVTTAAVKGGGAGEEQLRDRVPDDPHPELVNRVAVAEEIDDSEHAPLLLLGEVKPR
jgi:hypothetical protein